VIRKPWPAMLRGIFNDPDRYVKQYWSDVPGMYFTGDGARRDDDGYFWIMGRVDDVLNVSGHRLGTRRSKRAGGARGRRRGRGGRHAARAEGPGHRRVRHAQAAA
jgi:hypothetical protein